MRTPVWLLILKRGKQMIKYGIREDGVSFDLNLTQAPKKISRTLHTSIKQEVVPIEEFNRGIKRGNIILVSGDRPRFALMRTYPEDKIDPDLIKLGDCRIGISSNSDWDWIDVSDDIKTIFKPYCTEYEIKLRQYPSTTLQLIVSQAEDWGAVVKLSVSNASEEPLKFTLRLVFGGISRHGRTHTASYLDINNEDTSTNHVKLTTGSAIFSDANIPDQVYASSVPKTKSEIIGSRVAFDHEVSLLRGETASYSLIVGCKDSLIDQPDKLVQEASDFYDHLLSGFSISTPSNVLDAAFLTSIVNLEYDYGGNLWLEGVHWWSSYWPNNYQISAAISLGQLDRARKALDFLGKLECGPCPVLMASEKLYSSHIGVYNLGIEEGLPYYLYQLIQYYNHTGDKELILGIWEPCKSSIYSLLDARDGSRSGLLDWHLGCNGFLYQADHLAMPGDAASPSIMMSGILEQLSVIAFELGKEEDGTNWKRLSEEMRGKLVSRLWNEAEGFFYNHIDYQDIQHRALFYTDMVFPTLYSSLAEEIKFRSLENLRNRLVYETEDGRLMMRAGELKPTIFGNDTVLPAQMCEAARALLQTGDVETGYPLLESVAMAGTIYTEAPGNFPERMDDDGKGEANYIFGNPIGSFIYSVISGLFGIKITDSGNTLECSPAIPSEWEHADLQLPYGALSYKKNKDGEAFIAVYRIRSIPARKLDFGVLFDAGTVMEVHYDHAAGKVTQLTEFGKTKVHLVSAAPTDFIEIRIRLGGAINQSTRTYQKLEQPVTVYNSSSYVLLDQLDKKRFISLGLKAYCNSDRITATSGWRHEEQQIRLSGYERNDGNVEIAGITFQVNQEANGVRMVLLEHSETHPYTGITMMSNKPHHARIHVGVNAGAIALFYASECQSRQTGIDVGEIKLNYVEGSSETITLNVGKNIDTLFSHFANDTIPVAIRSSIQNHPIHPGTDYLNLLVIPCDSGRVLASMELTIALPDVQFGLIGMSVFAVGTLNRKNAKGVM
jgi:hypothetical protein